MAGPSSKFTRKKEEAIAALMTQRNLEEAARVAGIGSQTLLRWLKLPEFQQEYRETRRAAFAHNPLPVCSMHAALLSQHC